MQNLKEEVIKFAQKLNSTNLSPLRSGNVSVRTTINNTEGFLITPSGIKYELLKETDIVFLELNKEYDFLNNDTFLWTCFPKNMVLHKKRLAIHNFVRIELN